MVVPKINTKKLALPKATQHESAVPVTLLNTPDTQGNTKPIKTQHALELKLARIKMPFKRRKTVHSEKLERSVHKRPAKLTPCSAYTMQCLHQPTTTTKTEITGAECLRRQKQWHQSKEWHLQNCS
jgi:hypothetical protein